MSFFVTAARAVHAALALSLHPLAEPSDAQAALALAARITDEAIDYEAASDEASEALLHAVSYAGDCIYGPATERSGPRWDEVADAERVLREALESAPAPTAPTAPTARLVYAPEPRAARLVA